MKNQTSYDKRTIDRYVDKGIVKKSDYEAFMKNLPDETANAEWVEVELDAAEFEGDDAGDVSEETEEIA